MCFFDASMPPLADSRRGRILYRLVTVLLALSVLVNMGWIFYMSSEDRTESGDRSGAVTDAIVDAVYPDFDQRPPEEQESILQRVHRFIRKAAHFSEFMLLGFLTAALVFHLARRYSELTPSRQWYMPAAFCLAYAASDEIHQIFTERGPRVSDALLDFAGAIGGIVIVRLFIWAVCAVSRKCYARRREGVLSA